MDHVLVKILIKFCATLKHVGQLSGLDGQNGAHVLLAVVTGKEIE